MKGHKILLVTLIATIIMLQLEPAFGRHRSRSKSKSGTSTTGSVEATLAPAPQPTTAPEPQIDIACLVDFSTNALLEIGLQIASAVIDCIPSCELDAGSCLGCLAATFIIPPEIPVDCGTSEAQNLIICYVNYGIQNISDLIAQVFGAVGACIPCTDAGTCILCLADNAPLQPPPLVCPPP